MRNLPYILILTLFSHTLLWGQDTLKFEPLQLVDTVYSFEELNKRGNVEYVFYGLDSNFKEMKDSTLFMLETNDDQFIVKKINNNWVVYNYGWHGISNYWHKVDNRFYIKVDAMGNSGGGDESDSCGYWRWSWSYNSIFIFDVIDMRISSEIYTWFERGGGYQYDDLEGDDYKQKLMKCRNMFEEFNAEYELKDETLSVSAKCNGGDYVIDPETSDRIMTIVSKSHCNEEGYLQAGEYHYINGNFVKVKTYINQHTFTNTAYDLGEKTYLTPECAFYFECDCCSEHLLFTSDSTFVVVAPCTQDISVSQGKYEVIDNALHLHFSGIWQERYMVSDEPNKPTEYAYRTNTIPPHTAIFAPEMCKNTTLFSEQTKPEIKMLRSQETLEEHLEYLKKVGLIDKLKK